MSIFSLVRGYGIFILSFGCSEHILPTRLIFGGAHLTWRSCTPLKVRLITDIETNKPRGYAFVEYMHTRDMKTAYKQADGRKLDNRRVVVDVERGRTVPNWRPRRLGGGLGSTRIGGEDLNQKNSGRELQQIASGGHRRSEEPRTREDRHVDRDREKSRERGRDREREREISRDRDPKEDRHHHRDRERTRDRDRERDRSGRDRDRDRDNRRGRDRDSDRGRDRDHPRDRERDRDRGYDRASHERDRGHVQERDGGYDQVAPMQLGRERSGTRDRDLEPGEHEHGVEYYDEKPVKKYEHHDHIEPRGPSETEHEPEYYDDDKGRDGHRGKHEPDYSDDDRYGKVGSGYGGGYGREDPDQREEGEAVAEHDYGYQRSERSRSDEYER